jgi:hypothetical protein
MNNNECVNHKDHDYTHEKSDTQRVGLNNNYVSTPPIYKYVVGESEMIESRSLSSSSMIGGGGDVLKVADGHLPNYRIDMPPVFTDRRDNNDYTDININKNNDNHNHMNNDANVSADRGDVGYQLSIPAVKRKPVDRCWNNERHQSDGSDSNLHHNSNNNNYIKL